MHATDPRCAMLSELSQCAYRLGVAFGHEAERAQDTARKLEYFRLFDRCFFSVRVATALELRLWRTPSPADASREALADRDLCDPADPLEGERPDTDEAGDQEDREPGETEREREREAEPATLPVLLRTLEGVGDDAAALPGPKPAALPTLRELLAHVAPEPVASPRPDLRARLAGSATALTVHPPPRTPARPGGGPGGLPAGLAARRATGPPRS